MTEQLEILVTLILYILFFAWIGYQRGSKREAIVFITALVTWIAIMEVGAILVRIANLGGKFVAFIQAGGLGEDPDAAFGALGDAPQWVTREQESGFLFIVWVFILLLAYIISNLKLFAKDSKSDAWSILLGILNGLLFAAILLPRLASIVRPSETVAGATDGQRSITDLFGVLGGSLGLFRDTVGDLWNVFDPGQRSLVLLVLLTLFLLLVATSIRGAPRKTSSAERKS